MDDKRPRFLLLVPPPPAESTLAKYKEIFGDTIAEVLKEVVQHSDSSDGTAILEIALGCPQLVGHITSARASLYEQTQEQIALLYKLVVVTANNESLNVEDDEGADVRIIPVAWSNDAGSIDDTPGYGPIVTVRSLARSNRTWQYAFGVESPEGEKFFKDFVQAKGGSQVEASRQYPDEGRSNSPRHHDVAVGGTFDHLHIGHKLLLTMTLFAADTIDSGSSPKVTIGITGDELLKNKKYAEVLESWDQRQKKVEDFCDGLLDFTAWPAQKSINRRNDSTVNGVSVDLIYGDGLEVRCTQIQDPFGPTITEQAISALVISGETRAGGTAVNDKRKEKGWPALQIFEVDVLAADEAGDEQVGFEAKLSSTAIRQKLSARKQ